MSLEPSIRSRFGGSKVRSGCLTCKTRHVKCDETKPYCSRCNKAGKKCEGYGPSNQRKKRPEGTLIIINYVAPSNKPSLLPTADAQEQRSLEYFRTRTVPELAHSFSSELWSRFILQCAQHEPAIRHAIAALGSLHERFESAEDAHAAKSDFGLQQYGKAIQCVVQGPAPFAGQSTDVALISCIIFTAFESLQGHYRSALTHIHSGLKVLAEREVSENIHRGSYIPSDLLKSLFTRFDTQALEIGDLAFRPWHKIEPDTQLTIPAAFSTLEEAERVFDQYLNTLKHFFESAEVPDKEEQLAPDDALHSITIQHSQRVKEFQDWCNAFDNYLVHHLTQSKFSTSLIKIEPHPGVLILQIWRIVVRLMLCINFSVSELIFDDFTEEFRSIVDLAGSFVKQTATPSRTPNVPKGVRLTQLNHPTSQPQADMHPTRNSMHPTSWLGSCPPHGFVGTQSDGTRYIRVGTALFSDSSNTATVANSCPSPSHTNRTENSTVEPRLRTAPTNIAPKPLIVLKPTFSLSLGLITPLYTTATRCRDPIIRRRALSLLHTCNRKEGIWDSRLAARVAQRLVEVEEDGAIPLPGHGRSDGDDRVVVICASQIPEHARVHDVETSFLPDREGRIRYTKSTSGGYSHLGPREYYEELVQW